MSPFIQKFGLHPLVAIAMISVDLMLFGPEWALGPVGWAVSVMVAFALTIPCILLQRFAYRDEWTVAISKGVIIGILTAIPTPLPAIVTGASGILGLIGTAAVSLMKSPPAEAPREISGESHLKIPEVSGLEDTVKLPPEKNEDEGATASRRS